MGKKLQITYTKSAIGYSKDQKDTITSLGLHKLNSTVIHEDTPAIRGMAFKVQHLVTVAELGEETAAQSKPARARATATLVPEAQSAPAAQPVQANAPAPDDLAIVEGIGPKIAAVLNQAGITTFAQLATADVSALTEILQTANLRLADPTTWPEQARLAADANWDALKALQDSLKGGRRD